MHWLLTIMVLATHDEIVPDVRWAPRVTKFLSSSGSDGRSEKRLGLECVPVRFEGDRVTLGDVSFRRRAEFVFEPVWRTNLREISLDGACTARLDETRLFPSAEACRALGGSMVQTCEHGTCTDSVPRFELVGCEGSLEKLARTGPILLAATHQDAAKSYQRLARLTANGGVLWLVEPGSCKRVSVRAKGDGRVELAADSWSLIAVLEPLFNQGTIEREERWAPDGGEARWVHGDRSKVPIHLGKRCSFWATDC